MANKTRVEDILDRWEEARERGQELTAEELCRDCPELLNEVRQRIDALQTVDGDLNTRQGESSAESTLDEIQSHHSVAMHCELTDLRFHARGGLGVVCAARDDKLRRDLAVKFLRRRLAENAECRERFMVEAEVTSRLEHPGIVPVHGIGETDNGRLFYAMRLIQGDTLDDAIVRLYKSSSETLSREQQHARLRELLGHFIALCKTVAYAHTRGIVHRDIKPANVMLGRYGETILVDWGLALPVGRQGVFKQSTERTLDLGTGSGTHDSSGGGAGTLAYMSPEQATFGADVDQRSDIYSLGATLFKLITGRAAFEGRVNDVRTRVVRGDFHRPTDVNKRAPKALEAICLKAMSVRSEDRYETALELAQDVDNYLADAAVGAFEEPRMRRFARWARRHWAVVQGLMGGLGLLAVGVVIAALLVGQQAQRESKLKEQSLSTSAKFAARTLANQVDVCWLVLEKMAADPKLHAALIPINKEPQQDSHWTSLQHWLDATASQYKLLHVRAFFVNAVDGTQVARDPQYMMKGNTESKERFPSLGGNFNYRDYFHGGGQDAYGEKHIVRPPSKWPHNAAVHESTNQGALAVVFSVPIRVDNQSPPIGILGMAIDLGKFTALEMDLPPGQRVMLVDTRQYYLERKHPERHRESGEGLVLHHKAMNNLLQMSALPHIEPDVLRRMADYKKQATHQNGSRQLTNLLREGFHDPLSKENNSRCLAAFAPVIVPTRPTTYNDTGWFLIVQQAE